MTRHHTPSPEDRFNDYLDALASGRSTPDASDYSAGTNADPSLLDNAAREFHDLARAAESRQGGPPEQLWESIMYEGAATPGGASINTANPWEGTVPDRSRTRPAPDHPQPISAGARHSSSPQGGPVPRWACRVTPAASAAILLLIVVGIVALGTPWSRLWHEETPPVRLPALSGSLPATPFSTPVPDVNTCLADKGLVYRTNNMSDSGDLTLKRATTADGEDEVVSTWAATTVFNSGVPDIAIGIGNGTFTTRNLATGETTIVGYASQPYSTQSRIEALQFGPWVVAPANPERTDWTVSYLPTMDQTPVSSAYPDHKLQPFFVESKVSADGTTLALVVIPDDANKGTGNARPVAPSVLVMTSADPTSTVRIPGTDPDLATHADLVAVSPDGSSVSAPWVLTGDGDLSLGLTIFPVASLADDVPTGVTQQSLKYPVREGFAFFSPSGSALNYVIDNMVGTVTTGEQSQSAETGKYEGTLYGAVVAPGGEGALIGLRQTPAVSPSTWKWMDGRTSALQDVDTLDHFMFAHRPVEPGTPRVTVDHVVELTRSDYESGPSMVFFDPATGVPANELRDLGAARIGGSVSATWMNASTDGSLILTRLDDEVFIKANRPSTGEQWDIPVPEGIVTTRLAAIPSPDGTCIALTDADAALSETPAPIWVVAAQPGAEPVLVAEGWFSNWYQAPVTTGP